VNVGFMGVRVPAGEAEIRFSYRTPGLAAGAGISGACVLVWLVYCLLRRKKPLPGGDAQQPLAAESLSWEAFTAHYGDKQARALRLRQALDGAGRVISPLPEGERTLLFKPEKDGNTEDETP